MRKPQVQAANSLACIISACLRLAATCGVQVFLEQPKDSLSHHLPPVKKALYVTRCQEVVTHLGAFRTPIPKPLRLWSNCRKLPTQRRSSPRKEPLRSARARVHPYFRVDVVGAVTGSPALARTARYPAAFGEAVAASYERSLPNIQAALQRLGTAADCCRAIPPSQCNPDLGDRAAFEHLRLHA
jgi:hypothetical protein